MVWGNALSLKKSNMLQYKGYNMQQEHGSKCLPFTIFSNFSHRQNIKQFSLCLSVQILTSLRKPPCDTWCTVWFRSAFKSFHACFEEFSSLSIISLNPSIDHAHLNHPSIKFLMGLWGTLLSMIQFECQTMVKASKLNHFVIMEKYWEAHSLMKWEHEPMFKNQNKWHSAWLFST